MIAQCVNMGILANEVCFRRSVSVVTGEAFDRDAGLWCARSAACLVLLFTDGCCGVAAYSADEQGISLK